MTPNGTVKHALLQCQKHRFTTSVIHHSSLVYELITAVLLAREGEDVVVIDTAMEIGDFDVCPEEHHLHLDALWHSGLVVDGHLGMLHAVNAFLGVKSDDEVAAFCRNVICVVVGIELEL